MTFCYHCIYGAIKIEGKKMSRIRDSEKWRKFRLAMITGISNGFDVEKEDGCCIGIFDDMYIEVSGNEYTLLDIIYDILSNTCLGLLKEKKFDDKVWEYRLRRR